MKIGTYQVNDLTLAIKYCSDSEKILTIRSKCGREHKFCTSDTLQNCQLACATTPGQPGQPTTLERSAVSCLGWPMLLSKQKQPSTTFPGRQRHQNAFKYLREHPEASKRKALYLTQYSKPAKPTIL